MAYTAGIDTKVGIGLQTAAGTPAKAVHLVSIRRNSVMATYGQIQSQALTGRRARRMGVPGSIEIGGDLEFELGYDGSSAQLLYAALGDVSTVGAGPSYVHTIKPGSMPLPLTLIADKGPVIAINPDAYINQLVLRATLDEMVMAVASLVGRDDRLWTNNTANDTAAFGTAGLPSTNPFVFYHSTLSLDGGTDVYSASEFELTINNGLEPIRSLSSGRTPASFYTTDLEVVANMTVYWEHLDPTLKTMGLDPATATSPFEVSDVVAGLSGQTGNVSFSLTDGDISLVITLPKVEYKAEVPEQAGKGLMMQRIQATAVDPGGTDPVVTLALTNTMTNANLIAKGGALTHPA